MVKPPGYSVNHHHSLRTLKHGEGRFGHTQNAMFKGFRALILMMDTLDLVKSDYWFDGSKQLVGTGRETHFITSTYKRMRREQNIRGHKQYKKSRNKVSDRNI